MEYKIIHADGTVTYADCTSGSVGNNKPIEQVFLIKENSITEIKHWLYTNPKEV